MKRKDVKNKIKQHFFSNPTIKLRVRQLERAVGVALPSVLQYTKDLEKEGFLKKSIIANITLYSADRTSQQFLLEKKFCNVRKLYTSGLIKHLIETLSNPTIVVFGSYSKGEDIERSDIDLYIETPSKKDVSLQKFEKELGKEIEIFIHSNIHKVKNKELANNILNGVVINGFIEVFK